MNEAFFFGPAERQLFGNYHAPVAGDGQVLTVICPPLFFDYMRTHLTLRRLALALAERGQHVLRFDYQGTGDSFGDLGEVTVSDWVEDIALAVREGLDISGSQKVRLVGVRAGALLACRLPVAVSDFQRLVLWDPVPDGAAYLQETRRTQATMVQRHLHLSRDERRQGMLEYAGYPVSERMLDEFRLLDASAYSRVPGSKLQVVSTLPLQPFPVAGVSRKVASVACNWGTDIEDPMRPQSALLESLIACLTLP